MLVNQQCLSQRSISPLRYPGGKSKAVKQILPYFPNEIEILVSPFLGGGSLEILTAQSGVRVLGYDVFEPVVSFWQEALADSAILAETVYADYWPLSSDKFRELQRECLTIADRHEQAAVFFSLNRASFSGSGLSGGCPRKQERFTPSAIEFLRGFDCPNLQVSRSPFHETLTIHRKEFVYADPPYVGPATGLYGKNGSTHNGFDHRGLAGILRARERWVLSYDDAPLVRELYQGHLCVHLSWKYAMNSSKRSNEVLIFSRDVEDWAKTVAGERGDVLERLR